MDFEDILKQWENDRKGKKAAPAENMERLLEQYLPKDSDLRKDPDSPVKKVSLSERLPVQDTLDLHGMSAHEAEEALSDFFQRAMLQGFRKVLIIHGKGHHSRGEPVLKKVVRNYLERCPFAGQSGVPDRSEGGSGAVWVVLRKKS